MVLAASRRVALGPNQSHLRRRLSGSAVRVGEMGAEVLVADRKISEADHRAGRRRDVMGVCKMAGSEDMRIRNLTETRGDAVGDKENPSQGL